MPNYYPDCPTCHSGKHPSPFSGDGDNDICWCCGEKRDKMAEYCPTCGGTVGVPLSGCVGLGHFNEKFHKIIKPEMPKRLTVYKSLDDNYKSTFRGFIWPLPTKHGVQRKDMPPTYEPGPWLEIEGDPVLCTRGFHGWLDKNKAFNEGAHVYEMELEGKYLQDHEKACGTRARLVKEIFLQPEEPWEAFVSRETSALEIVKEAHRIRKDLSSAPWVEGKVNLGYHPVVPSFHDGPPTKRTDGKLTCGTCGLNEQLHDGWEARAKLANKLHFCDRWELILYIQQLLNGKDPGLDMVKSEGS